MVKEREKVNERESDSVKKMRSAEVLCVGGTWAFRTDAPEKRRCENGLCLLWSSGAIRHIMIWVKVVLSREKREAAPQ